MKRVAWLLALGGLVATAAVVSWGAWRWNGLHEPFGDPGSIDFEIPAGQSAARILERLEESAVVRDASLARLYLIYALEDPPLQAGDYRFETPTTVRDVIAKMVRGEVVLRSVTVIEGLTLEEIASHLASEQFGDEESFLDEMRSTQRIADLDPEATDLEGYLFPETYSFPRSVSESEIVDTMVQTFRVRYEEVADLGIGVREWVTLASIVEKEAQLDAERPIIAGVYRNRLDRGIALFADPTIIFALKRLGRWDGDIRRRDLSLESPYNTYLHSGLPPGPICSPGFASLEAAASPAAVNYLYFVSRNDGSHVFAATLREHNRNVDEWQRRYWREQREKEAQRD